MQDISMHILDIARNSIDAGASRIIITVEEDESEDMLRVTIEDNGRGMDEQTVKRLTDPFFTTKGKKTGLGIPLLAQSAREAGGGISVRSAPGMGTTLRAEFRLGHIDRKPLGDLTSTIVALIGGNPDVEILFRYRVDGQEYVLDTAEIKRQLGDVPISYPGALSVLRKEIAAGIERLWKGGRDELGEGARNR
ncbi:MAG: ATP-binding protein [Nitrospirae bacterium]|nr:ATP-binding protein [Nitrospirota bacterium]